MVSNITVSENEFNSEDPHQGNNRLMHRKARVTDVYAYRGDAGYKAPTGSLHQEDKVGVDKYGNGLYNYDVSITNPNSTPIHKGALIVAAYKFFNDAGNEEIKISSANGEVDEEIEANVKDYYVTDGMVNTELGQDKYKQRNNGEPIRIGDYDVRVIDGVYNDGSLYKKEYYDKYGVK
jgi:hypothetical protein